MSAGLLCEAVFVTIWKSARGSPLYFPPCPQIEGLPIRYHVTHWANIFLIFAFRSMCWKDDGFTEWKGPRWSLQVGVFKLECSAGPPRGFGKHRLLGSPSRASNSAGLRQDLRVCISQEFPGDADAAGLRKPRNTLLGQWFSTLATHLILWGKVFKIPMPGRHPWLFKIRFSRSEN